MTEKNLFKLAARRKTRFPSTRGDLTAEQLYDLPLTALDQTARAVNTELKSLTEESFVDLKPDPRRGHLADALELVKEVIADKQADKAAAEKRATNAAARARIVDALARAEDKELGEASIEDLKKKLAEIDGDVDEA